MTITAILPARTDSAYRAEDEAIERAEATLRQAEAGTWTREAAQAIRDACEAVRDAIDLHEALRAGVLGWEAYDTELREYAEPARHGIAIAKSAEDAEELAGELAEVIGRYAQATGEQAAGAAREGGTR